MAGFLRAASLHGVKHHLHSADDDHCGEDPPDPRVSLRHGEPGPDDRADHASSGHNEAHRNIHHAVPVKNGKADYIVKAHDNHFYRISPKQVHPNGKSEPPGEEKSHSGLDEPSVYSYEEEHKEDPRLRKTGLMLLFPHLRLEHQENRHEGDEDRHGKVEVLSVDSDGQKRSQDLAKGCYSGQGKGCPEAKNSLLPVRFSSGNALQHYGEPVRTVCDSHVHTQERKEREDQKRASPADGIEETRNDAHEKDTRQYNR